MKPSKSPSVVPHGTVRPSICCVVPAYNEADGIATFLNGLCQHLASLTEHYEVIVVDDGSQDGTGLEVIAASGGLPVRLLSLSRNFGKEAAISAGLEEAGGEVVVIIDADFQQPFAVISDFIGQWQQGYDMVYGLRTNRDTDPPLRRFLSRAFYRILSRCSALEIPADAGDFRLLDRRVVDTLRGLPERSRFMKGLYSWVGFRSVAVPFVYGERHAGSSKFNFSRLFDLAMTGLTSFSAFPLRFSVAAGVLASACSIVYALYIIARTMMHGPAVPGWASLAVAVSFLGGIQLMSIGLLGEYVARIFTEVKGRPNYIVAERHGFPERRP